MKRYLDLVSVFLAFLPAHFASGHGTPINVGQSANALVVSGGLLDSQGFASHLFFEDDEEGDPFATVTLPNVGAVILWEVPGYNITGLDNSSSLSIEVLSRSVQGSDPLEERIVWYWDPESECVKPTTTDMHLLGTGMRFTTLSADASEPPPTFLLAATLTGQQNKHNHDLLRYALDNDEPPVAGAYGFFARLTASLYAPSDPFLILINHNVNPNLMETAALAINAAATHLQGDFNHDGIVDAADYVVWRKSIGTVPQYEAWRSNFGATAECCDCELNIESVPEPRGLMLAAAVATSACMMAVVSRKRMRRIC